MKKFIFLLIFVTAIMAQEAKKATATPVFWKVEAEKPVYLLGTIHMGIDASKEFPAKVWEKLSECDTLVLELDITKVNQLAMMMKMQLPPSQSLEEMLGADHWAKFEDFVKPAPAVIYKKFKPWVVQTIAAQKFLPPTPGVELTLIEMATARKMEIKALETVDDQLGALDAVPQEQWVDGVKRMLDDVAAAQKEMADLLRCYRKGDLEGLKKLALDSEEAKKMPEMIKHVMIDRNKKWIPKIEEYIKKGNVFIAVGAAHFVGKEGVIKLLEAKGYKVSRIQFAK